MRAEIVRAKVSCWLSNSTGKTVHKHKYKEYCGIIAILFFQLFCLKILIIKKIRTGTFVRCKYYI